MNAQKGVVDRNDGTGRIDFRALFGLVKRESCLMSWGSWSVGKKGGGERK